MIGDNLADSLRDKDSNPYKKLMEIVGDEKKLEQIADYLEETCNNCWIGDASCQCWNDE